MIEVREEQDRDYKKSTTEFESSEEEDIEENYSWFNEADPNSYFCLCTKTKNVIEKDQ